MLTSVYAVIRGSFWGNKQFLAYSVIELAEDAVMVGVGIALIWGVSDPVLGARYATVAVLASYIFSFAVSLFWYFKSGGRFVNPKKQFKPLLSSAMPVTAMRTSTSLLNSTIAVLLPTILMSACGLSNSEAVSLYGIAVGMAIPMLFMPNSFIGSIAVVAAPELSENYYRGNTKLVRYDVEKTLRAAIFIATILIPVLFAAGGSISIFLYDSELCGQIVKVSAFIVLPMCITMMSNTLLNSMNCEKQTLLYFTVGAVTMLFCVLFLTRYLGVYSYVLGLGLAQIITATFNLRLLKKKCGGVGYLRYVLMSIAVIVAASIFGGLVHGLLQNLMPMFWLITVSSGLTIAFTLAVSFCLNMISLQPVKKMLHKN